MQNLFKLLFLVCLLVGLSLSISAQTLASPETSVTGGKIEEDAIERVKRLESKVTAMLAELEALKRSLRTADNQTVDKSVPTASVAAANSDAPGSSEKVATENKSESVKKDLSIDAGDYRVTPYGIIFFNAFANSNGTNNADDPLWATSGKPGNSGASGRQTRLGVRITGGKFGGANVSGVVEADFYGGFPGVGVGENMGVLRLRVAKATFEWEKTSLLIGQDWILFAPNNPQSIAAAAIPQFAAAGNPWARLPQIRIEQKIGKNFKFQGALLAPSAGDFPAGGAAPALLQPGSGSSSKVPFIQSRIAYSNGNWFGSKKNGTIGLAGHYGRSRVSSGNFSGDIDGYGIAFDWSFPIVNRVSISGEVFSGENLGGMQAGIFQGYNSSYAIIVNNAPVAAGVKGIRTHGGWTQLGWNLPGFGDRLNIYGSVGIEDPHNQDLVSHNKQNFRTRNFGYAFDLIYKLTPQFSIGGEFRRLETSYFFTDREKANHLNFGASYSF